MPKRSCLARMRPMATGSTNSRWLGLKQSDKCTFRPDEVTQLLLYPRWYLTSPRADVQPMVGVLELAEDQPRTFVQNVGQHVEPPAVPHADHDFVLAFVGRFLDRQVEQGDERFGPLEREALGSEKLLLHELFEHDGIGEPRQNADLLVARELDAVLGFFHAALQPLADFQVVDVHELHADAVAVGALQRGNQLAQRARRMPADFLRRAEPLKVRGAEIRKTPGRARAAAAAAGSAGRSSPHDGRARDSCGSASRLRS